MLGLRRALLALFVAGTAVFGAPDPARAYAELATKIGCS